LEPFKTLRGSALPFAGNNVDTDQILPARFLSRPRSGGFAQYLFHDLRFNDDGSEKPGFILNQPQYRESRILIGEENFGCGSSRENAVWAVSDYGFRAVVASSFGDIFFANSLKNGVLPVVVKPEVIEKLMASLRERRNGAIEVNLVDQTLTDLDGIAHHFEIDAFSKHCLLNGIDELDYTLSQMDLIDAFEHRHAAEQEWDSPPERLP
jgi:3-isopropylmalate/(R)-2-methylmalate dehydratase small subunit